MNNPFLSSPVSVAILIISAIMIIWLIVKLKHLAINHIIKDTNSMEGKIRCAVFFLWLITWVVNISKIALIIFNNGENVNKDIFVHAFGLFPPFSLFTIWL